MRNLTKICMGILSICLVFCLAGCKETTDGDENVIKEITTLTNELINYTKEGDYPETIEMLDGSMKDTYAPVVVYNTFTSQYPESETCKEKSMDLAKYVLSRLYNDFEIEKVSISQDKSKARVLATWKGIDTSKVDTTNLKETINDIVDEQYENNKEEYDNYTLQYGEEETQKKLQDDAFPKIFEELKKLYEKAPDKDMKGILCYNYRTDKGYALTGIAQYMDLIYNEDGTYNWSYEDAQSQFDKDKELLESGATNQ